VICPYGYPYAHGYPRMRTPRATDIHLWAHNDLALCVPLPLDHGPYGPPTMAGSTSMRTPTPTDFRTMETSKQFPDLALRRNV
jgi:hypothetical protein